MTTDRHRTIRAALIDAGVPIDQADRTATELASSSDPPAVRGDGRGDAVPRGHALRVLFDHAAMGERPSDETLDPLGPLPAAHRTAIVEAAEAVTELRRQGRNAEARTMARDAAQNLWGELPDEVREYRQPRRITTTNPAELAADVPRY